MKIVTDGEAHQGFLSLLLAEVEVGSATQWPTRDEMHDR